MKSTSNVVSPVALILNVISEIFNRFFESRVIVRKPSLLLSMIEPTAIAYIFSHTVAHLMGFGTFEFLGQVPLLLWGMLLIPMAYAAFVIHMFRKTST